jgi:hypothetical protein
MPRRTDRQIASVSPTTFGARFDAHTAWAVGGALSTFWGVVIAIILSFLSPIRTWSAHNHLWLVPALAVALLIGAFVIGLITASFAARNAHADSALGLTQQNTRRGHEVIGVTDLRSLWERERQARTVWVISPELHYEILNPTCHEVVAANRLRSVEYRYIVQDSAITQKHIEEYQKVFGESDANIEARFLRLPASELSSFLTEIVVYDAATEFREAYGYPPASALANPDVIVFGEGMCERHIERFTRIWLAHKVRIANDKPGSNSVAAHT